MKGIPERFASERTSRSKLAKEFQRPKVSAKVKLCEALVCAMSLQGKNQISGKRLRLGLCVAFHVPNLIKELNACEVRRLN